MDWRRFLGELQRRNVYRVAVTYAVVSWVLIQIATQVFPFFDHFLGYGLLERGLVIGVWTQVLEQVVVYT